MDPATTVHLRGTARADARRRSAGQSCAAGCRDGWERYPRIAEIIDADEERRRLGRERFKAYRDLKVALETHQLDDTAEI